MRQLRIDAGVVNYPRQALPGRWLLPGSVRVPGMFYAGSRHFGYLLFAAYLLTILAVVPTYTQLFNDISRLAGSGELTPNHPYAVIHIVHELVTRAEHSFGKLLQASISYFAIASAICLLQQRLPETDIRWSQPSAGYGLPLIALGWLCPGASQLLQKRARFGCYFLGGYIGSHWLSGFFFHHNSIDVPAANSLDWLSVAIKWGFMAEALFWMIKKGKGRKSLP